MRVANLEVTSLRNVVVSGRNLPGQRNLIQASAHVGQIGWSVPVVILNENDLVAPRQRQCARLPPGLRSEDDLASIRGRSWITIVDDDPLHVGVERLARHPPLA